MIPPLHPEHPETVTFVPPSISGTGLVDRTRAVARCGRHFVGTPRELGREEAARELAADLNAHRATYAGTEQTA